MSARLPVTGGCLCGAVRYRSEQLWRYAVHCHCSICRRSSGAGVMTWVCLPRDAFALTRGVPARRPTSAQVERAFCDKCGTQLFMDYQVSDTVDVSIGSLDRPQEVAVLDNIFVSERLSLMKDFDATLPSHDGFAPGRTFST